MSSTGHRPRRECTDRWRGRHIPYSIGRPYTLCHHQTTARRRRDIGQAEQHPLSPPGNRSSCNHRLCHRQIRNRSPSPYTPSSHSGNRTSGGQWRNSRNSRLHSYIASSTPLTHRCLCNADSRSHREPTDSNPTLTPGSTRNPLS